MSDPAAVARFPEPHYSSLQASSYNRASTNRNQPDQTVTGWFADSDGLGFVRTEVINGKQEWVIMEHQGPGCLTKLWTPFFYYGFNDLKGPNIRVYLDGASTPVLDESLIDLVTGKGTFKPPFSAPTARAGNSYVPIPFGRGCKVTMTGKPFYYLINYRAYPEGTRLETFTRAGFDSAALDVENVGKALTGQPEANSGAIRKSALLQRGDQLEISLPEGAGAVRQFTVRLPGAMTNFAGLRSTVLRMACDGEETVWCSLGDFFCSADSLHPIHTWQRTVMADGTMVCRWVMPYRREASMSVLHLGAQPVEIALQVDTAPWKWDERSMCFHANWRPDEIVPGTPFRDWNFIDIHGKGVFVGDAWTVLNIQGSWWGEGDEKIYVDGAWEKGFPTHFGTGTEDYYGWAGGEVPTRKDEFSVPFLANARVGGLDGRTTGFNICTRTRSLDAIPFTQRLVFDMESSFGTDIRRPWNLLGYSAVTFWYAMPGATHNCPPRPAAAARPILSVAEVRAKADAIRAAGSADLPKMAGGLEFERLKPSARSPGLQAGSQRPADSFNPRQWSGEEHFFIASQKPGDFVEFTFTEQFSAQRITLYVTTSYDFGEAAISINGKAVGERVDLFSSEPKVRAIDLGVHRPIDSRFVLRCELVGTNSRARGAQTFMGLDCIVFKRPEEIRNSGPVRVFVLAGQSNAEGHNHIRQYQDGREAFPEALRVQPRILFWPGTDTVKERENLWTLLRVGESGAFGPEISFARETEQMMPGATIAIVKYAAGGTGIARSADYTDYIPALAGYDDQGRNWHPPSGGREAGSLYRGLMANVRSAMSALERDGRPAELSGFLWMQGEHEGGISRKMAEDYEELLSNFVASVRKDLHTPSLPIAVGQVNSHMWAYGEITRKCQSEVCRKDKRTALVETIDLPRVSGDAAHFTANGMLTLGSRFAKAMAALVSEAPEPERGGPAIAR